jgi:hypothetical protein
LGGALLTNGQQAHTDQKALCNPRTQTDWAEVLNCVPRDSKPERQ